MYVYIRSESNLWTVGFYDPKGDWHSDSDHESKENAAQRVNYLNGSHLIPPLIASGNRPWTQGDWGIENKGNVHGPSARCEIWAGGMKIAEMAGLAEFDYANARLMIKAHALYEALEALVNITNEHGIEAEIATARATLAAANPQKVITG